MNKEFFKLHPYRNSTFLFRNQKNKAFKNIPSHEYHSIRSNGTYLMPADDKITPHNSGLYDDIAEINEDYFASSHIKNVFKPKSILPPVNFDNYENTFSNNKNQSMILNQQSGDAHFLSNSKNISNLATYLSTSSVNLHQLYINSRNVRLSDAPLFNVPERRHTFHCDGLISSISSFQSAFSLFYPDEFDSSFDEVSNDSLEVGQNVQEETLASDGEILSFDSSFDSCSTTLSCRLIYANQNSYTESFSTSIEPYRNAPQLQTSNYDIDEDDLPNHGNVDGLVLYANSQLPSESFCTFIDSFEEFSNNKTNSYSVKQNDVVLDVELTEPGSGGDGSQPFQQQATTIERQTSVHKTPEPLGRQCYLKDSRIQTWILFFLLLLVLGQMVFLLYKETKGSSGDASDETATTTMYRHSERQTTPLVDESILKAWTLLSIHQTTPIMHQLNTKTPSTTIRNDGAFPSMAYDQNFKMGASESATQGTITEEEVHNTAHPTDNEAAKGVPPCTFDAAFLLDESGSIRDANTDDIDNWDMVKIFVSDMVLSYRDKSALTNFAVTTFSDFAEIDYDFRNSQSQLDIRRAVSSLSFVGGNTNTTGGLNLVLNNVFTQTFGDRIEVPNLIILITDGIPNVDTRKLPAAIDEVYRRNITLVTIGVGTRIDEEKLELMVQSSSHLFRVVQFVDLKNTVKNITNHLCEQTDEANNINDFR